MGRQSASPTFITEIPLKTTLREEVMLIKRLEAGRQLYNACLGEAMRRVKLIRQSKLHQTARKLPKDNKNRTNLFKEVNQQYSYSEYALHSYAKYIRASWIGEHIDANTAQTIATRAFRASQKVLFGRAKRVRFKGKNQLDSLEGKTNKQGIRWKDERLVWSKLEISPLIMKNDPVIWHGLNSKVKYVRLVRRKLNGKNRFYAQLVCEGFPYQKPLNCFGGETVGLDLGPSTIAIVGETQAKLTFFVSELDLKQKDIRRLQRKLERQRRGNNPNNYNENGTVKKGPKKWQDSQGYKNTKTQLSEIHRKQAAHRKSLHGRLINEIIRLGKNIKTEKLSYKAWQKNFGKSINHRAPSSFLSRLKQKAENAGGRLREFSTITTALSQNCHCGIKEKKPLSQRVHRCNCGVISQRDLYSAYLARFVDDDNRLQADLAKEAWSGAELLLWTAWQQATDKTNQQLEGRVPSSFGKIPPELELVVPKVIGAAESLDDVSISNDGESQTKVVNQITNHAQGGGCYEPPALND